MEEIVLWLVGIGADTLMIITVVTLGILLIIINLIHGGIKLPTFKKDLKHISKKSDIKPAKDDRSVYMGRTYSHRKIYLKESVKNVYVCGTTGSGKTVALSNFVKYGVDHNLPLLIVDGKGDISEDSLLDIVMRLKRERKVYVIDLNHPERSSKYNPFKNTSHSIVKDMLINMTDWSEEHYKYNTERYLQRLVEVLNKSNIELSFKSVVEHMNTDSFEMLSAQLLKAERITKQEHVNNLEIIKNAEAIIAGAVARFSTIIESEPGVIFDKRGIDIYTALNENAVILFILNPLIYPELSKLIGRVITIDSKKAVSNFYEHKPQRGFFLFDEINVYASTALLDLVNKSRSANITSILASQSLSDLTEAGGEYFREQVIENCNNYVVLRQNSAKNAEEWANIIGTTEAMSVTHQIRADNHSTSGTGLGSATKTREYICHPDEIKNLPVGTGFLISKDNNFKTKIIVHKPF